MPVRALSVVRPFEYYPGCQWHQASYSTQAVPDVLHCHTCLCPEATRCGAAQCPVCTREQSWVKCVHWSCLDSFPECVFPKRPPQNGKEQISFPLDHQETDRFRGYRRCWGWWACLPLHGSHFQFLAIKSVLWRKMIDGQIDRRTDNGWRTDR